MTGENLDADNLGLEKHAIRGRPEIGCGTLHTANSSYSIADLRVKGTELVKWLKNLAEPSYYKKMCVFLAKHSAGPG